MSLHVYSGLILAAPVSRADFFDVRDRRLACTHSQAHAVPSQAKRCPECGDELHLIDVEQACPAFARYAATCMKSPEQVWHDMTHPRPDVIGLHRISAVMNDEVLLTNKYVPWGLGLLLAKSQDRQGASLSVEIDDTSRVVEIYHLLDVLCIYNRRASLYPFAKVSM